MARESEQAHQAYVEKGLERNVAGRISSVPGRRKLQAHRTQIEAPPVPAKIIF